MVRVALALIVVACSSGTRVGSQPSWRGSPNRPGETTILAPASDPVQRYNEPIVAPARSPLGDAVLAAAREAALTAKIPPPVADARLSRACAEIAEIVPADGNVPERAIEFALQRQGIIEPSPQLSIVWEEDDRPDLIVDKLRPHLVEGLTEGVTTRVGVGTAKRGADGTAVVYAIQAVGLSTSPILRALPAGGELAIEAVLDPRYRDPQLFVTREGGPTERLAVEVGRAGAFKVKIACGPHRGRQQVEITASDVWGSNVLANFPLWCGVPPPSALSIETVPHEGVIPPDEAERRLLALINRDRQAAGLPALQWDDRVAALSRAHSEDMRRTKIVAHVSATTGNAGDRVRAAGIKASLVLENVARSYGVGEAHAGLMNSPGHRMNILAPQATHVGIGVIPGPEAVPPELFLTQVFIRVPPRFEAAQAADLVHRRLQAARPAPVSPKLTAIAQDIARGLAAGKSRDALWPGARKDLDAIRPPYARVGSVISAVADIEAFDGKELLGDDKPDELGVGIAQGRHPDIGEGAIWIVVLVANTLAP